MIFKLYDTPPEESISNSKKKRRMRSLRKTATYANEATSELFQLGELMRRGLAKGIVMCLKC
jgi:hypothetical protein